MSENKLNKAIEEAKSSLETQGVKVTGGKKYLMVKDRLIIFRSHYADEWGISTEVISSESNRVVVHAKILNEKNITIGSGLAEEEREGSGVNSTSALENAETSAIGRALASLGLHGGEYASADEMAQAISGQNQKPKTQAVENKPTSEVFDDDWKNTIVPNTKHKGKKLGELQQGSLKWFIENWQPWRGSDGDREPTQDHIKFRGAIDSANQSLFGYTIEPTDEISSQGSSDPTDPENEETPF